MYLGNGNQKNSYGKSRLLVVLMIVGVFVMGLFSAGKLVFPQQSQTQTTNTSTSANVQKICLQATGIGHRGAVIYAKTLVDGTYQLVSDKGNYNWVVASTIELHQDEMFNPDVEVLGPDGTRYLLKSSEQAVYINGIQIGIKCQ